MWDLARAASFTLGNRLLRHETTVEVPSWGVYLSVVGNGCRTKTIDSVPVCAMIQQYMTSVKTLLFSLQRLQRGR